MHPTSSTIGKLRSESDVASDGNKQLSPGATGEITVVGAESGISLSKRQMKTELKLMQLQMEEQSS